MIQWSLKKLPLELKFPWKISRGTAHFKTNFLIESELDELFGHGEVAFNSRYGENESVIERCFDQFVQMADGVETIVDLHEVLEKIDDLPNSLRFGIESSFFHLQSALQQKTVPSLIASAPRYNLKTSFSMPIQDPGEVESFIRTHDLKRFDFIKIKLGHEVGYEQDLAIIDEVSKHHPGVLRLDANEAFKSADDAIKFTYSLNKYNIEFLEQPLPSKDWEGAKELFRKSQVPIIADESLESHNVTKMHQMCFHGVNIKLMKSGGYLHALKQIRDAKKRGMKIMIGCMIESSLGILSALNIAGEADYFDLDGHLLLREDPFKLVEEQGGTLMMGQLN